MADAKPPQLETMILERLVRQAMQYVYTLIARGTRDHHAVSADVAALIELLISKGVISFTEMADRRETAKERLDKAAAATWEGPQLHVQTQPTKEIHLDCDTRKPSCQAACCRLYRVNLTPEEVRGGKLLWDLAVPYALPRLPNGDCAYLHAETLKCTIWENRPTVCRGYSCEKDTEVWSEFANMVPTDRVKLLSRAARESNDKRSDNVDREQTEP